MLISKIIEGNESFEIQEIINEKEFDYFALTAEKVKFKKCVFINEIKYINEIDDMTSMIITKKEISELIEDFKGGYCITNNPKLLFYQLHNYLDGRTPYGAKSDKTNIVKTSKISHLASIAEKNVFIGDNCLIEEFVVIRENTYIGSNSIIRAGSVIGGQGFDFYKDKEIVYSISHQGGVKIGSNVEIQQNTCIDRAVFPWDMTFIDDYTKIDNLVHIAHSVKIGKKVLVTSSSSIAGRTIIGDDSWIGVGAILSNGIKLGKSTRANIGSVVVRSIPDGESQTGYFAIEHSKFLNNFKKSIGKG